MKKYNLLQNPFKKIIKNSGINLDGLVLDLCSSNISIASVYNPEQVVCYEYDDKMVKELRKKGIKTVQANIRYKRYFPFQDNSFDYLFLRCLPLKPSISRKKSSSRKVKKTPEYIERITSEIIRVTQKNAIISSYIFTKYFPKKYKDRIVKQHKNSCLIVLNCAELDQ